MDKKFVMGIAAMAALTLVSCSSDDLDSFSDNSSKNEAISFDGYLGRSAVAVNGTRGSEETVSTLKTNGFGVFGTYTPTDGQASNLFDNQKLILLLHLQQNQSGHILLLSFGQQMVRLISWRMLLMIKAQS